MNGAEHWAEAERLAAVARELGQEGHRAPALTLAAESVTIARAQLHATLALVAATEPPWVPT